MMAMYTNIIFNPAAFKQCVSCYAMQGFIQIPAWTLGEIYAHNDL